ncbi:MAG: hypothetical protein V4485_00055 [Pseudomonadota bacterium]
MRLTDDLKRAADEATRPLRDAVKPPSTIEMAQRSISDAWYKEVKPLLMSLIKSTKKEVQATMSHAGKELDDFAKDPKKGTKQFFEDIADALKDLGSSFPIMTKFVGFIKAAGSLVTSMAGSDGDKVKAWTDFNKSKTELCSAIKKWLA